MSNKSELQANNTDLRTILEMVTNLPEAGSQLETCDLNITTAMCSLRIYYTTIVGGQIVTTNDDISSSSTIQVLCNSIFYVDKASTVFMYDSYGIRSLKDNYLFEMLPYDGTTASIKCMGEPTPD